MPEKPLQQTQGVGSLLHEQALAEGSTHRTALHAHLHASPNLQPPAALAAQVVELAHVRQAGQQRSAVVEHGKVCAVGAHDFRPAGRGQGQAWERTVTCRRGTSRVGARLRIAPSAEQACCCQVDRAGDTPTPMSCSKHSLWCVSQADGDEAARHLKAAQHARRHRCTQLRQQRQRQPLELQLRQPQQLTICGLWERWRQGTKWGEKGLRRGSKGRRRQGGRRRRRTGHSARLHSPSQRCSRNSAHSQLVAW